MHRWQLARDEGILHRIENFQTAALPEHQVTVIQRAPQQS